MEEMGGFVTLDWSRYDPDNEVMVKVLHALKNIAQGALWQRQLEEKKAGLK